ncbi:DUF6221 family protein [Streptomyces sp. DSM 41534]
MTAQGEDILAWTNAAISRREDAARHAARVYGPKWVRPVDTDVVRVSTDSNGIWFQCLSEEIAEHVIYNSPEVVLRRCAADRKILELHSPDNGDCSACAEPEQYSEDSEGAGEWTRSAVPFPCDTVRALAEGYGWTEGER